MKLLTAAALSLTMAGAAFAESHAAMEMTSDNLIRSRDITGGEIYTMNAADDEGWSSGDIMEGVGNDWNQIGEIEDIVLSKDGKMVGIIAEIGGFLDVADKHVMIRIEDVNLVAVDDQQYAYVTRLSEEDLEGMEDMDEGFWD